ncbi:helix-turn-helix transcriptional regulator [Streptomyces spectabilis]|uniref:DNA-binding CsgD family transcriptional regulator n=1 Tax=Streptomyces spectabilis TaxID=68270 RepID=A0A5P2XMP8_STRST|nr:LuxR family transcriptional regulator [Streptomyces spectabilis]MBB5101882.1 DNA-binding CsgD family transcriptional regulator [Streptomyces spectabilis]MCI3906934.1 AAA family ATPase [Streptomyces spectabilis]QEV63722.1 helix-turn-helix transcriptional regulator [Streptomyces spectabilis]GGV34835.1 LuxR family transcriptional regulator [Streptomyces spectabilis]
MTLEDAAHDLRHPAVPDIAFCGRAPELAALRADFAAAVAGTPRLVLLEGPGGIGKTTLVRRFLDTVDDGTCVLHASGEENESALPCGVLAQLVGQSPLPVPDTLAGLLVRTPQSLHANLPPLSAGFGLIDLLSEVQSKGPVVLVVDDAHWADPESLNALTFALRRLRHDRVLAVVALRDPHVPELPEGLRRLLTDARTRRLALDGLSPDELAALSDRLGVARLPHSASLRLHTHTHGNPLHARALLDQVPSAVLLDVTTPLPAPRSYAMLVLANLAGCGTQAQRLVQAVSVLGLSCRLQVAARLAKVAQPLPALERAVKAGLLRETHGGASAPQICFPHPLVHAAVYQDIGPAQRAALHTRAAALVADEYSKLRHRVLAATGPDEQLAAALAACARREAATGQWAVAGTHLRHASRVATSSRERDRLAVEAVEALLLDGRVQEAAELATGLPESADPALRGYVRGYVARVQGRTQAAWTLLVDAWEQCDQEREPALAARAAEQLSYAAVMCGQAASAARWAERAQRLSTAQGPSRMLRFNHLIALGLSGRAKEGIALAADLPDPMIVPLKSTDLLLARGELRLWSDDLHGARHDLRGAVANCRATTVPLRLLSTSALAQTLHRLGEWDEALIHAESAASIADDADQWWLKPVTHGVAAQILAARGAFGRAAEHLRTAGEGPGGAETPVAYAYGVCAQGHCADARGEPRAVVEALRPLLGFAEQDGVNEPGVVDWQPLLVDALVQLGELDEAEAVLGPYEELARARGRHSALAAAARIRGNLLAARREPQRAQAAYVRAQDHAAQAPLPFVRARVALDHGAFLRRIGRRSLAIAQLQAAHTVMTELGALPYQARCVRELSACGRAAPPLPTDERAREGADDSLDGALTPQELAVARLAAQGLTNRQIATSLALSVKTIEYHLGHTYAKLGITSRIGLVQRLGPQERSSPSAG